MFSNLTSRGDEMKMIALKVVSRSSVVALKAQGFILWGACMQKLNGEVSSKEVLK